ncbi:TPR repeat protein [Myroides gitamensis]|nr:TPR repeat protein [Myroides gitamensis]
MKRNKYQPYIHIYYGILYDHGYGVKQSEKKAVEHYEHAIEHSSYFYAVERLLYYYKEHPKFQDATQYQRIVDYARINEIEIP